MRRFLTPLLAAALLGFAAIPSLADAPRVVLTGTKTIPAGGTLILDASGSVSDKPIVYAVKQGGPLILVPLDSGGRAGIYALAWNVPAGTYRITAKARGTIKTPDGQCECDADIDIIEVVVVAAPTPKPDPPPQPPPGPTPDPPPVPPIPVVTGQLWAVGVMERDDLIQLPEAQRNLLASPTLASQLEPLKCHWKTFDDDALAGYHWQPAVAEVGQPALIVVNEKAEAVWKGPLPGDGAAVVAIVSRLRGK